MKHQARVWSVALALLVLCGLCLSQAAAASEILSGDHATHCCGVCHSGHSQVTPGPGVFLLAPLAPRIVWHVASHRPLPVRDLVLTETPTRAPPA